ncbi:MAG: manganese efflux pump MntP family protein [Bacillota bacterium]
MDLLTLLLVAVALGTDAFSVALGIGMRGVQCRELLLLSGTVLAFHVVMPLIGVVLGGMLGALIGQYAAWIGAGIIILIGLNMIREALRPREEILEFGAAGPGRPASLNQKLQNLSQGGWGLFILGFSVSLDALSVGFGLGTIFVERLAITVGVIGGVAGVMTAMGLILGRFLGRWIGTRAGLLGGLVLVLVGCKIAW